MRYHWNNFYMDSTTLTQVQALKTIYIIRVKGVYCIVYLKAKELKNRTIYLYYLVVFCEVQ